MADDRTYIKLHDGMPGHPKVRGLSDKAFRAFVSALCYCSEYLTDGEVVAAVARDLGSPKVWAELTAAGLVDVTPSGYQMHDYLDHQRSSAQVAALKEAKRRAGSKGGRAKAAARAGSEQGSSEALAPATGAATEVPRSTTGSKTYPETESLTNVRDQTETDPSLRSGEPRKRGHRLPNDFSPSDDLRAWAIDRGFNDGQIAEMTDRFADHWHSVPGTKGVKTNWDAAWRNWVGKEDPRRVRSAALRSVPDRRLTSDELLNILGPDHWRCPEPPAGLTADEEWEWRRVQQVEHIQARQQMAAQRMAAGA